MSEKIPAIPYVPWHEGDICGCAGENQNATAFGSPWFCKMQCKGQLAVLDRIGVLGQKIPFKIAGIEKHAKLHVMARDVFNNTQHLR